MNIDLDIPNYDGNALDVIWGKNAHYSIHTYENHVVLSANKYGLKAARRAPQFSKR